MCVTKSTLCSHSSGETNNMFRSYGTFSTHAFRRLCSYIRNTLSSLKIELDFGFELHTFSSTCFFMLPVFSILGISLLVQYLQCKIISTTKYKMLSHNFYAIFYPSWWHRKCRIFCIRSMIFVHYKYHWCSSWAYLLLCKWFYKLCAFVRDILNDKVLSWNLNNLMHCALWLVCFEIFSTNNTFRPQRIRINYLNIIEFVKNSQN